MDDASGEFNYVKYYFRKPTHRSFSDSLLHSFGSAVGWVFKLAFGGFEEPLYRRDRRKFIADIERDFSALFSERTGWIVPHEGEELPRSFDYVAVTVEFKEIRFRLIRGRGELRVQAAPPSGPQDWQDLSILWHRVATPEWSLPPSASEGLSRIALRLGACWDRLIATLSAGSSRA